MIEKTLKYCLSGAPGRAMSIYYAIAGIVRQIRKAKCLSGPLRPTRPKRPLPFSSSHEQLTGRTSVSLANDTVVLVPREQYVDDGMK